MARALVLALTMKLAIETAQIMALTSFNMSNTVVLALSLAVVLAIALLHAVA